MDYCGSALLVIINWCGRVYMVAVGVSEGAACRQICRHEHTHNHTSFGTVALFGLFDVARAALLVVAPLPTRFDRVWRLLGRMSSAEAATP